MEKILEDLKTKKKRFYDKFINYKMIEINIHLSNVIDEKQIGNIIVIYFIHTK